MNSRFISSAIQHTVQALALLLVVGMTITKQPHNNLTIHAFLLTPISSSPSKKRKIYSLYLSNQNMEERTTHVEKQLQQENQQQNLLNLLSQLKPNQPTSQSLTKNILQTVKKIELNCPLNNNDDNNLDISTLLEELNGNWELIWTAQDKESKEALSKMSWINPLENQVYSNNPLDDDTIRNGDMDNNVKGPGGGGSGGRANPILPQRMQNTLEKIGFLTNDNDEIMLSTALSSNSLTKNTYTRSDKNASYVKSSQAIDIRKGRVRNVVSLLINNPLSSLSPWSNSSSSILNSKKNSVRASLTVDIKFKPNELDRRKIDVKFDQCRITVQNSPIDVTIPFGFIGPTGK